MKKLNVLVISGLYPSKFNDMSGVFIARQAECLARHGVDCSFLVPRPWAPWPLGCIGRWQEYARMNPLTGPEEFAARIAPYIRPPGMWFRRYEGRVVSVSIRRKALAWHKQKPFDLVFGNSMGACVHAAVAIGKRLSLPVASLAIGSDVMVRTNEMPILWKQLGDMLEDIDLPIGVSQMLCDRMMQTGKCQRAPLLVYLGRDTASFAPAESRHAARESMGISPSEIVAVYVGALVSMKGMDELAMASKRLLREYPDFRLICIGDGNSRDKLEFVRKSCQVGERIVLPGMLSPSEVPQYLQAADFFVFPSYSEGMPQAVLEAMNCGLPVVATRVGGTPEAVVDGETGILIDPRDADQLEIAMRRMICDGDFRQRAGAMGFKYANDKFDPDSNAEKLAESLRELVN